MAHNLRVSQSDAAAFGVMVGLGETYLPLFVLTVGLSEVMSGLVVSVPVLLGGGSGVVKRPREEFVVHFPHYDKDAQGPASAIYVGDLKLIHVYETGALKLFNIVQNPGERRDLAAQMPDKAKELDARLMAYLKTMNAQMPKPNPNYDAKREREPGEPTGPVTLERAGQSHH